MHTEDQSFFRAIVESSDDAIVGKTLQGVVTSWNPAAERIFGYSAAEMIGQSITRLFPPDRLDEEREILERITRGERVDHFRTVRRRKDGVPVHVSVTISPILDDAGRVVGASKIARDIGDQIRAEEDRAARALADEANREKTAFLGRMSHELRTPLHAMLGFADLSLNEPRRAPAAQRTQRLQLIRDAGRRLLAIVDDLLDISSIELGSLKLHPEPTELMPLLRTTGLEFDAAAKRASVTLMLPPPGSPSPWAHADGVRLLQVLTNLVSNAIKYNHAGGEVELAVAEEGADAVITVRDDGAGIAATNLSRLGQAFQRLGPDASIPGRGIGLSIARRLVDAMGGTLHIHSEPGSGSRFVVRLRRCDPVPSPAPGDPVVHPRQRGDVSGTLIYVEDEPVNQLLMQSCLAFRPKVMLHLADDGASALRLARELRPDAMVIDMMLPDTNGIELSRQLRGSLADACPRLYAFSADGMPGARERAQAAGFAGYLLKPAPPKAILDFVDQALARE